MTASECVYAHKRVCLHVCVSPRGPAQEGTRVSLGIYVSPFVYFRVFLGGVHFRIIYARACVCARACVYARAEKLTMRKGVRRHL